MNESVTIAVDQGSSLVMTYGLSVVAGIVILLIGWWLAGVLQRWTKRTLAKQERIDDMLAGFFASVVRYLVLIVTVLAVLSEFGVQTASLIAVLGAAGLAVGLALQGTLSNVAAGVMLLIFRPFKIGDFVDVAGHAGTVKHVTLFVTEMATPDNVQIVIPNSQVWGSSMKNFSFHETRRVDLVMGIDYSDDIELAKRTILDVIGEDDRVLKDPAPMTAVSELADSSVNLVVRVWCASGDYWPLKFELTEKLKKTFDQVGLTIPFPQRTIHQAGK